MNLERRLQRELEMTLVAICIYKGIYLTPAIVRPPHKRCRVYGELTYEALLDIRIEYK